ncbi:MAG: SDR family NAD(P)-dependent oxidoreductase [Candidatus Bipolaricaulia bacterium]
MTRLAGKVAFVTGAAMGMGQATAELFAANGAKVAVTDFNTEAGRATTDAIVASGGEATFIPLDVANEAQVEAAVAEVVSRWGTIDVLVNCAGVIGPDKETHEVTEAEWDALFAVDVKGVFFATKHVVPHMIAQQSGSIINFSSIYGLIGNDEFSPYHVAKGAVTMMTKQDAASYGKHNIRVNSVHPSTVLTPLVEGVASAFPGGLPAYEKHMTSNQSIRRLGQPIDVAQAVLFLASDESTWITGVNLPIDGGYTAR